MPEVLLLQEAWSALLHYVPLVRSRLALSVRIEGRRMSFDMDDQYEPDGDPLAPSRGIMVGLAIMMLLAACLGAAYCTFVQVGG